MAPPLRIPPQSDADRFVARMNALDRPPSWTEAASLGVPLIDLSETEFSPATVDRYFLTSGEVIQRDPVNDQVYQSGWWYAANTDRVQTPLGERLHRPGISAHCSIDPTATIDPTARIESGATIGAHARVGAYSHIGRDTTVGRHSVVRDGAWIGTNAQLGQHSWVSDGATVEPHCVLGHHASVGAGSRVTQGSQIEPYSRLAASTTTSSTPRNRNPRSAHLANAVENLMRLDRE